MSAARSPVGPIARVRAICLALPEAEERPFGGHTAPAFRVRDKLFVMTSEDATSMTMKAPRGAQQVFVASDPERFFVPKYVGPKGWVGVRLDLRAAPDCGIMDSRRQSLTRQGLSYRYEIVLRQLAGALPRERNYAVRR